MATAKTTAMYEASQNRYDRLVSYGAEKMLPASMKYLLGKLQDMRRWATNPVSSAEADRPLTETELEDMREKTVLTLYRQFTPEAEKVEAKIRQATPGGLPEEKLIMQPAVATATPTGLPKWLPWTLAGVGAVILLYMMSKED